MALFNPIYRISPPLLDNIKRIAILIYELNRQTLTEGVQVKFLEEARAVSTFASTSIEGNPLPLTEVKRLLKKSPKNLRQSEQEVLNYNQVLVGLHQGEDTILTTERICQIHEGVVAGLWPMYQSGQWRREPVVVNDPRSGEIVYLPPDYQEVSGLMEQLVSFVETNRDILDPIVLAGLFHKQMVVIHPFVDGNGRSTRLATKLLLADLGLDTFHLFSFENYYNRNVTRYFQQVGLFGNYYDLVETLDFTPWLEYFADGIVDELLRVQKQIEQHQATPNTRLQAYHQQILDYIDTHGFITDRDYALLTNRAKATRTQDFRKLIELKLIERHGRGRNTHYKRLFN